MDLLHGFRVERGKAERGVCERAEVICEFRIPTPGQGAWLFGETEER